jgi:glutathionyl-hydroquinone reductase
MLKVSLETAWAHRTLMWGQMKLGRFHQVVHLSLAGRRRAMCDWAP